MPRKTRRGRRGGANALESVFRGYKTGEMDVLARMLGQRDSAKLREVSKPLKQEVERSRWDEFGPPIKGSIEAWRRANPSAETLNLRGRLDVKDADFVHLRGIKKLDIMECTQLSDAAFQYLDGVQTLVMNSCNQETITDAAFVHLKGIHTLDMSDCSQETITDAAFANLTGIHTLLMSYCEQETITDAAFAHLKGIHTLDMSFCEQETITDKAFESLRGISSLNVESCNPAIYTSKMLQSICSPNLKELTYREVPAQFEQPAEAMFGTKSYSPGTTNHIVKFQKCKVGGRRSTRRRRR